MHWHEVLTGSAFKSWLIELASTTHISAGTPLDPFTTSNRNLVRVTAWLNDLERGIPLVGERSAQAITDLIRAKLVTRVNGGDTALSALGQSVLNSWNNKEVADNREEHELARCISLIREAIYVADPYYTEIKNFWHEVRQVYDVNSLFNSSESLYLLSYLNQIQAEFNPWLVVRASRAGMPVDQLTNWDDLFANIAGPEVQTALTNLRGRINGWRTRSQGRLNFCRAMELVLSSKRDALVKLEGWGLHAETVASCRTFFEENVIVGDEAAKLQSLYDLLLERYNVILFGPPGTGKTRSAFNIADLWERENGIGSVFRVTFHPSYGYEDFVEGFRPDPQCPSTFKLQKGILLTASNEAKKAKDANGGSPPKFLLIIDEINRGDTARIFGELITYMEHDKRNIPFKLTQSPGSSHEIPDNLYFLGTMNTADKSVSLLDVAMRRRFAFMSFPPDPTVFANQAEWLERIGGLSFASLLTTLNARLQSFGIDQDRAIGHALLKVDQDCHSPIQKLKNRLQYDIHPLILEYCYMNRSGVRNILGDLVDENGQLVNLEDEQFIARLIEITGTVLEEAQLEAV